MLRFQKTDLSKTFLLFKCDKKWPNIQHTVNDLINAHSQINTPYLIDAPLEVYSLYQTPLSNKRPLSNRRPPLPPPPFSVLDEPNLPNPFIVITDSDVEEANDAYLSVAIDPDDDDDIDVEL